MRNGETHLFPGFDRNTKCHYRLCVVLTGCLGCLRAGNALKASSHEKKKKNSPCRLTTTVWLEDCFKMFHAHVWLFFFLITALVLKVSVHLSNPKIEASCAAPHSSPHSCYKWIPSSESCSDAHWWNAVDFLHCVRNGDTGQWKEVTRFRSNVHRTSDVTLVGTSPQDQYFVSGL